MIGFAYGSIREMDTVPGGIVLQSLCPPFLFADLKVNSQIKNDVKMLNKGTGN